MRNRSRPADILDLSCGSQKERDGAERSRPSSSVTSPPQGAEIGSSFAVKLQVGAGASRIWRGAEQLSRGVERCTNFCSTKDQLEHFGFGLLPGTQGFVRYKPTDRRHFAWWYV